MKEAVKNLLLEWKEELQQLKEVRKTFKKTEQYRDHFVAIDNQIMYAKMFIADLIELKKTK